MSSNCCHKSEHDPTQRSLVTVTLSTSHLPNKECVHHSSRCLEPSYIKFIGLDGQLGALSGEDSILTHWHLPSTPRSKASSSHTLLAFSS
jgi:hypothetical protein